MKAIIQTHYGAPEDLELREIPRPEPAVREVLVRVRAASVHPDVWHVVAGRPLALRLMGSGLRRPRNPVPGTDVAGVVEAVGAGVTRFRPGDEVFGETLPGYQWTNGGAYAEFAAVREDLLAPKPASATFEQAASLPTAGFIALLNFRDPERFRRKRVLVNGAAGGVGSITLQVAKAHGAHVTAVDGPAKLELCRSLGADEVIDYTREDFTRRGDRYHLVFDVPGNRPFREVRRVLEPDGRYVLIGHDAFGAAGRRVLGSIPRFVGLMARSLVVKPLRPPRVPAPTKTESIEMLRRMLEAGQVTPVIDSVWPLAETGAAIRHMMEGALLGKVVVKAL